MPTTTFRNVPISLQKRFLFRIYSNQPVWNVVVMQLRREWIEYRRAENSMPLNEPVVGFDGSWWGHWRGNYAWISEQVIWKIWIILFRVGSTTPSDPLRHWLIHYQSEVTFHNLTFPCLNHRSVKTILMLSFIPNKDFPNKIELLHLQTGKLDQIQSCRWLTRPPRLFSKSDQRTQSEWH